MLARVRDVTAMLGRLPAAPTFGWCDRAAECLRGVGEGCTALVAAGMMDSDGRVLTMGQVGLAGVGEAGAEGAAARALRNGVAKLEWLGFAPAGAPRWAEAGIVERHTRGWPAGPVGRMWIRSSGEEMLTAACGADASGRRVLMVYIVTPGDSGEVGTALRAVMPLLAVKARAALARVGATRAGWVSVREQAVLDQLAAGRSIDAIAQMLGRSRHTVMDHLKSVRRKLDAGTRSELVVKVLGREPAVMPPVAAELVDHGEPAAVATISVKAKAAARV